MRRVLEVLEGGVLCNAHTESVAFAGGRCSRESVGKKRRLRYYGK
jgi:hypothetical protein